MGLPYWKGSKPFTSAKDVMLTLEQYKLVYPNAKCWAPFDGQWNRDRQIRLIMEGMLQFTKETACCWAGPFEGNYAHFVLNDYTHATHPIFPKRKMLDVYAEQERDRKEKALRQGKPYNKYDEYPSHEFPIKLYVCGNDDTSYSKCYASEKEALDELELFIGNEPLDFHEMIDFGFIFTN